MKLSLTKNLGLLLLGVWLILWGGLPLLKIGSVPEIVLQLLAVIAGLLILVGR